MTEPALEFLFRPRSIAMAGASPDERNRGNSFTQVLQDFRFPGPIYPINPGYSEVLGLQCYPRVQDVPGPVDYVVSCVPARLLPSLMRDCGEKGVKSVTLHTGRLAESGVPERVALQKEVVGLARQHGIRLVGPNCMGIYCPGQGISFRFDFPRENGPVGYLSQSGGNCIFVHQAAIRGIRFSKVISFGNAADLNECDLLEYFIQDPETRIITAYLEGVKDGRRFFRLLQQARRMSKPIIVLKGGRSGAGTRAVASHTGSLAGSEAIWDALFRQTGVLRAANLEEMEDLTLAFLRLTPPKGRRMAVLGGGGGSSVQSADDVEAAGLHIPPLPSDARKQLQEAAPDTWFMVGNPLDQSILGDHALLSRASRMVVSSCDVDGIIWVCHDQWAMERPAGAKTVQQSITQLLETHAAFPRLPVAVVLTNAHTPEEWKHQVLTEEGRRIIDAGLALFPSTARAANAVGKLYRYYEEAGTRKQE